MRFHHLEGGVGFVHHDGVFEAFVILLGLLNLSQNEFLELLQFLVAVSGLFLLGCHSWNS